jgi:hypothetical protein
MGTEQKQQSDSQDQQQSDAGEQQQRDSGGQQQYESGQLAEKPEVTEDAKEKAKEMAKSYNDDLQTTTLPGSEGTVAGTAVTDWVDEEDKGKIETSAEEGKVEYRNTEEFKKIQEE